jgi:lysozyme family protein
MDGTGQLSRMIQKKKAKKSKKVEKSVTNDTDDLKLPQPKLSQDQVRLMSPLKKAGQRSAKLNDSLDDLFDDIKANSTAGAATRLPEIENKNGPAKATIYSSADDLKSLHQPFKMNRHKTSFDQLTLEPESNNRINSAKSVASSSCTVNSTEHRLQQFLASEQNVDILNNLSYVAYQRKMMNDDRRNREILADSVLQKYQDSIDREKLKQESDFKDRQRELAKKVAAFNLETQEDHQSDRNQSKNQRLGEQAKAYIFQRRPLTPARFEKQTNYSSALAEQVTKKSNK